MKKAITATLAGALLLGAAVPALAQQKPVGLSLRAGIFFPTDTGLKDPSDAFVSVGVDYRLAKVSGGSTVALSLDYAGKADTRIVPITLNYVIHGRGVFLFAGAGIGFLRDSGSNTTSLTYEGGIGFDITSGSNPLFLQAKYIGSSDQNVNGIAAQIGVRF